MFSLAACYHPDDKQYLAILRCPHRCGRTKTFHHYDRGSQHLAPSIPNSQKKIIFATLYHLIAKSTFPRFFRKEPWCGKKRSNQGGLA